MRAGGTGQGARARGRAAGTHLSTLMAHRLKMEAVHSMTSIAMSASQRPGPNSHTPPWTCARGGGEGATDTRPADCLPAVAPGPGTPRRLFPTPLLFGGVGLNISGEREGARGPQAEQSSH